MTWTRRKIGQGWADDIGEVRLSEELPEIE